MAEPTAQEVLMWAMINRARLDPNGEAARFGISLNEGPVQDFNKQVVTLTGESRQPLAFNDKLFAAADAHAQDILNRGIQFHNDPVTGASPQDRAVAAGYNPAPTRFVGENIAFTANSAALDPTQAVLDMYKGLFVDQGTAGRGHRYNILLDDYQEVGVGQAFGKSGNNNASEVSQDFGKSATVAQFLTGIAYNDTDHNAFYSVGEGRGGIKVQLSGGSVVSQSAGNFSTAIGAGVQTITFSGGDLAKPVSVSATVTAGRNALIDLVDQSTVETSVSLTAISGVSKIIGLGNIGLTLTGNGDANTVIGSLGNDTITGAGGNDTIDGGAGSDIAVFLGKQADYQITVTGGTATLKDMTAGSPDGTDTITNIELVKFADGTVAFSSLKTTAPPPPPPPPAAGSITIDDVTVTEGNGGTQVMKFTVARTGGTAAFDVNFATKAGSASAADGDYVGRSSTLHFDAGQMKQTIEVTINGDTTFEGDETFSMVLSNATNGAVIADGTGIGKILNDDAAAPSVSIDNATVIEGDSGTKVMTFTVTRTDGSGAFDVDFATKAGSASAADGDYLGRSNTLHFDAGQLKQTISVTINGDTKVEGAETFKMVLSNATNGATIVHDTGIGTILDNDVVTEDFNGDGKSDILFHNASSGAVAMWQQNGMTTLANVGAGTQPTNWHAIDTVDFNGDGKADILWQNDDGRVQLWQMNGATTTQVSDLGSMASNWHISGVNDFSGDGKADVLWSNDAGQVQMWSMNGASHTTATVGTLGAGWSIKDTADFNGDGKADILLQNGNQVAMWQMDGAKIATSSTFATVGNGFHVAGAADFNGDGKSDILWHNDSTGQVMLWEMDGSNVISNTVAGTTAAGWEIKDVGDFNHDGHADILLQNSAGAIAEWQMNGDHLVAAQGIGSVSTDWHLV